METEKDTLIADGLFDGRYRIESLIGTGGMAKVYKAEDSISGRTVALKMLKDEISGDKEALARFTTEAKAMSLLSHPNIIGIYDISLNTEKKYLVMEYAEGISLRTYMDKRGALSFDELEGFSEQILAALNHAHSKGVVHRDIKPQNIMIMKDGIVKVTDFGIAKLATTATVSLDEEAMGTVYYISPEQAEGAEADNRSDLYSLGVMMYEMATGELPFYNDHAAAVLLAHIQTKPEPPRQINRNISRGLEQFILCAMEKNPEKRYQSALDMFRELRRLKKSKWAMARTAARIKKDKRSKVNRENNRPSRSMTPVILGIAFALLAVGIVSVFTALDRLKIGTLGTESITVPDVVGQAYADADECGSTEAYKAMLENLGLGSDYKVSVEYLYTDLYDKGTVMAQSPAGGASRKAPCDIKLTVSLGVETVILGDYTDMEMREAETKLRSLGFQVEIGKEDNPVFGKNYVIRTSPEPGSRVKKGSKVYLSVSNGIGTGLSNMPDLTGYTEAQVVSKLNNVYHFKVGKVTYTRSLSPAGTVLFHTPAVNETVYQGFTTVDFVVSGGPDFGVYYIPTVKGMKSDKAIAILENLGFQVSVRKAQSKEEVGTVINNSIVGIETTTVYLTVSGGEDYSDRVYMLNVIGNTSSNAETLLSGYLADKTDVRFEYIRKRSDKAVGTVIAQSPAANERINIDGNLLVITLTVSEGPDYSVMVKVPGVTGVSEQVADLLLTEADISSEKIYIHNDAPAGTVLYQSEKEGVLLYGLQGLISIRLTISLGPEETLPEVTTGPEEGGPANPDETADPSDTTEISISDAELSSETAAAPEAHINPVPETSANA